MEQLPLLPWNSLTLTELVKLVDQIRTVYWQIRNLRGGKFGSARRRRAYRQVSKIKEQLLLAGIPKAEILTFLACCRSGCRFRDPPCIGCKMEWR